MKLIQQVIAKILGNMYKMTAIVNTYNKHIEYSHEKLGIMELILIRRYYKGKLNSYNDEPAWTLSNGDKAWFKDDKLHRDNDLPSYITHYGAKTWCKNGKIHRDNNKPAKIYSNGTKEYWINGIQIK